MNNKVKYIILECLEDTEEETPVLIVDSMEIAEDVCYTLEKVNKDRGFIYSYCECPVK